MSQTESHLGAGPAFCRLEIKKKCLNVVGEEKTCKAQLFMNQLSYLKKDQSLDFFLCLVVKRLLTNGIMVRCYCMIKMKIFISCNIKN